MMLAIMQPIFLINNISKNIENLWYNIAGIFVSTDADLQ